MAYRFFTGTNWFAAGAVTLALGLLQIATPAQAQLLNQLGGAMGSGQGGAAGGLTGGLPGGLPAVGNAGAGNTAGVLQYCVRNNYLNAGGATSVQNSLMGKAGLGNAGGSSDSGFNSGSKGLLETGNGQSYSLGGSGIKEQATRKVCDMVLQHAKSLL